MMDAGVSWCKPITRERSAWRAVFRVKASGVQPHPLILSSCPSVSHSSLLSSSHEKWVQGQYSGVEEQHSLVQSMIKVCCKVKLMDELNLFFCSLSAQTCGFSRIIMWRFFFYVFERQAPSISKDDNQILNTLQFVVLQQWEEHTPSFLGFCFHACSLPLLSFQILFLPPAQFPTHLPRSLFSLTNPWYCTYTSPLSLSPCLIIWCLQSFYTALPCCWFLDLVACWTNCAAFWPLQSKLNFLGHCLSLSCAFWFTSASLFRNIRTRLKTNQLHFRVQSKHQLVNIRIFQYKLQHGKLSFFS